jgi:hypothetical protein
MGSRLDLSRKGKALKYLNHVGGRRCSFGSRHHLIGRVGGELEGSQTLSYKVEPSTLKRCSRRDRENKTGARATHPQVLIPGTSVRLARP